MSEAVSENNLVLTTFLPSQQIKHLAFFRIDAPKLIVFKGRELKLVSGLAMATRNVLRLFAVYEQAVAFELSNWRLHEDIVSLHGWDRIIIVNTGQRVVGLRFENNVLRNTFMLSLEFLPVDDLESCEIYPDRLGFYFLIKIRGNIVLCLSQTLAAKYKSHVYQREKIEIIGQEVRWNDPNLNKVCIADVVRIKIADINFNNIEQIRILDENIYFIGRRGKEAALCSIQIYTFYGSKPTTGGQTVIASPLPQKDQPPSFNITILAGPPKSNYASPDFLYIFKKPVALSLVSQQTSYEISTFESEIHVLPERVATFPLVVWEPGAKKFILIQKCKTFQDTYEFKQKQLAINHFAEIAIYREGLLVTASRTDVVLFTPGGHRQVIHKSIGNIIDFHVGRDILFIQNYEERKTRLFQISRGPRVDPRPFVTHKKKMFLEEMSSLKGLFTIRVGGEVIEEFLVVQRGNIYSFYKEEATDFYSVLMPAREYHQFRYKGEKMVLLRPVEGTNGKVASFKDGALVVRDLQWTAWTLQRRQCLSDYFIGYSEKKWHFFSLGSGQLLATFLIDDERADNKFINSFLNLRQISIDRQSRGSVQFQLYLVFSHRLQIWLLNLDNKQSKMIYLSIYPAEGSPFLSNDIVKHNGDSYAKDMYRSITCPEYCLSEHGLRTSHHTPKGAVLAAYANFDLQKKILLLVTSENKLLIYRSFFGVDQSGLLLRRVATPLYAVKFFTWRQDASFRSLGQGVVRAGSLLFYKGEFLQGISAHSFFKMDGILWTLLNDNKIRQVRLGADVIDGFWIRQIQCGFTEELMGIQSTPHYYCAYSRRGFEIFNKQFESHWRCNLVNEIIVALRTFEHYLALSYYDFYCNQEGVCDYQSIKFKFRVYNCTTKSKTVEREKPLDEPILHIRYMPPDKILLVTSSVIFINILKSDKTMESFKAHNFTAKRSFLTCFAHIPDKVTTDPKEPGRPTYMLMGSAHGGLAFYVGKWIEEDKLREVWFEGIRSPLRHVSFFYFGTTQEDILKALVADDQSNLLILGLKKEKAEKIADIRLGALVNSIKSIEGQGQGTVAFIALNDGSIRLLKTAKADNAEVSFLDFQSQFCEEMPFIGGFNLRRSRQMQQKYRSASLVSKGNMVDGDLLQQFFSMTETLQNYMIQQSQMQVPALKSLIPF